MSKIDKIFAREILDSRGNPTISTTIFLDNGKYAFSSVPSGISTGTNEAHELRDRDKNRYNGMGVLKAVGNVNTKINEFLKNSSIDDPILLDKKMIDLDGTTSKENLGANAILSVSIAINKLCAIVNGQKLYNFINNYYEFSHKISLPTPLVNVVNGSLHADSNLDFQEFWIVPESFNSFKEKLRASSEIFHILGKILSEIHKDTNIGNEGGYGSKFFKTEDVWICIMEAINRSGYLNKIKLGVDAGSNNFFNQHNKKYLIKLDKLELSGAELINYYLNWIKKYPINYFEDPFEENDWSHWKEFKKSINFIKNDIKIIGDDLFTTNIDRLKIGIEKNCANTIIIKPNQIGSVSETIDCIKFAQKNNFNIIVSHRSGETCDDFIADLCVGAGSDFIKTGAPSRGERICKYNRLLEIEDELI